MKKSVLLLVFAALMVAGLVALAADKVEENPAFTIPSEYSFVTVTGDLEFPGVTQNVPSATGWFYTNFWTISFMTNYNLTIGMYGSAFKQGTIYLKTEMKGSGVLWGTSLTPWKNIPNSYGLIGSTKAFTPGVYTGKVQVRMLRNGYNNPAGTYICDPVVSVYGL